MKYRDFDRRILVSGYSDLGVMFPMGVVYIIMTDITTGLKWLLTWNTTVQPTADGFGRISLSDDFTLPRRESFVEYAAGDGPRLKADGEWKLIVDNSRLGVLFDQYPIGVTNITTPQPYAKKSYDHVPRLIYMKLNPIKFAWTPEFAQ